MNLLRPDLRPCSQPPEDDACPRKAVSLRYTVNLVKLYPPPVRSSVLSSSLFQSRFRVVEAHAVFRRFGILPRMVARCQVAAGMIQLYHSDAEIGAGVWQSDHPSPMTVPRDHVDRTDDAP